MLVFTVVHTNEEEMRALIIITAISMPFVWLLLRLLLMVNKLQTIYKRRNDIKTRPPNP